MKKITTIVAGISLSLVVCIIMLSCQKERSTAPVNEEETVSDGFEGGYNHHHGKSFSAQYKTFYRISPLAVPAPVTVNNINFIGFANFPGGGDGYARFIGNSKIYFNQMVYTNQLTDPPIPLGSVISGVKDILGYPVTGAPLPLIQKNDFDPLKKAVRQLHIPVYVHRDLVNAVIYDHHGNALFLSVSKDGGNSTHPISETYVGFTGVGGIIVGGRGKFEHAHGEFKFSGKFNVMNPNDAEYNIDEGWIEW
jgi:hypothetical protein